MEDDEEEPEKEKEKKEEETAYGDQFMTTSSNSNRIKNLEILESFQLKKTTEWR